MAQPAVAATETALAGAEVTNTEAGMVLGTASYMSPEQIRAQPTDHRSDIFSFGLVLYEMLTGRQAFHADSAVETMSAILKADPPRLADSARELPPDLERIVFHCLEKNPEERFQSAGDIAFHLESIGHTSTSGTLRAQPAAARQPWRMLAAAALIAVVGAGLFLAGRATRDGAQPQFEPLTFRRGSVPAARFAPDGRTVVYSASWEGGPLTLYSAQPGNPESRSLEVEGMLRSISKTGELAILIQKPMVGSVLARMPFGGGAPREVLEGVSDATWGPDGEALAVVRAEAGRERLEYPIGRVLHEPSGWISNIRVSPDGDHVAFADHPVMIDNRGDVSIVDLSGRKSTLSADFEDIGQLAWSPDGREIWFSASRGGTDHSLFAVTLAGETRQLLTGPGSLGLQDVSADGRVILVNGGRSPSIVARPHEAAQEAELAWMDFSWLVDMSEDGRQILFSEQGVAGGPGYAVYLRGTDGSPAVRLGKGDAHALSHDGRWAIATDLATHTLTILPTGAGQPRSVPAHDITAYPWAGFFPGDARLVFAGTDKNGVTRMYAQDLEGGGPPRPLTPDGVAPRRNTLSPDGRWLAANFQGEVRLFPVEGGEPRVVAGGERTDVPLRWNADGRLLYVRNGNRPTRVVAIDVTSGARTLLHEIALRDPVGATIPIEIRLTPDGAAYAFSYLRTLQNIYQVTGLH